MPRTPIAEPPTAIGKIIEILEATLGSVAMLRQEITNGPAIVLRPSRQTFAVFFAEEFLEDYPAHRNDFDAKLLLLPEKIKGSPTRAVYITAQGEIEDFESNLVFATMEL